MRDSRLEDGWISGFRCVARAGCSTRKRSTGRDVPSAPTSGSTSAGRVNGGRRWASWRPTGTGACSPRRRRDWSGSASTRPSAIGQRALLVPGSGGTVLWDCVPYARRRAGRGGRGARRAGRHRDLPPALLRRDARVEPGLRRRTDLRARGRPGLGPAHGERRVLVGRHPGDPARPHAGQRRGALRRRHRAALGRRRRRAGCAVHRRHLPGRDGPALAQLHVQLPQPDPRAPRRRAPSAGA